MKIADILKKYPYFFLAKEEDNNDILQFFNSMVMETKSMSLRYDRSNDFFKFAKIQSPDYFVFIMKDEKGIIRGTASIALLIHRYNGKKERCAYLGDLRISPLLPPKIRIHWKKCYSELIENFNQIEEFIGVEFLYSAILDENQNAMRSLLKNNDQIIYHQLTSYETFNVIAPHPFTRKHSTSYTITQIPWERVKEFLIKESHQPGLQPFLSEDSSDCEIEKRFERWDHFSSESFYCVLDKNQKIIAAFAPWKTDAKKLVVQKMDFKQKCLTSLMPLLGVPAFKENAPINVLYLTHLTFDSTLSPQEIKVVLTQILFSLLKKREHFHLISFFTYPEWKLDKMPFFMERTKANFYQVMSKKQFIQNKFLELNHHTPNFEIGIA